MYGSENSRYCYYCQAGESKVGYKQGHSYNVQAGSGTSYASCTIGKAAEPTLRANDAVIY